MTTIDPPSEDVPTEPAALRSAPPPPRDSLGCDISSSDSVAHVRLTGSLTSATVLELGNVLAGLIQGGHRGITVDMGQLRGVDEFAAGVLNRAAGELRRLQGELRLIHTSAAIAAVLHDAGLSEAVLVQRDDRR